MFKWWNQENINNFWLEKNTLSGGAMKLMQNSWWLYLLCAHTLPRVIVVHKFQSCWEITSKTMGLTTNLRQLRNFDWLCWVLMTCQPLWVILFRLPEKGRKEIEEIVEEMKERIGKKKEQEWKWRNRRNKTFPLYP